MTDDPNAAYVTPAGRNHPAMNTPIDTLTRDMVQTALIELLTIGQHHYAATTATLDTVGDARQSTGHLADDRQRLAVLSHALDMVGGTLTVLPSDIAELRRGLADLAAVALSWLDVLPYPTRPGHAS